MSMKGDAMRADDGDDGFDYGKEPQPEAREEGVGFSSFLHRLPKTDSGHEVGMMEVGYDANGQLCWGPRWLDINQTDEILRAALSRLAAKEGRGETAWLVEWGVKCWDGGYPSYHREVPGQYNPQCWTSDPNLATRYARKEDAEAWLRSMGYEKHPDKYAAEHAWTLAAPATSEKLEEER